MMRYLTLGLLVFLSLYACSKPELLTVEWLNTITSKVEEVPDSGWKCSVFDSFDAFEGELSRHSGGGKIHFDYTGDDASAYFSDALRSRWDGGEITLILHKKEWIGYIVRDAEPQMVEIYWYTAKDKMELEEQISFSIRGARSLILREDPLKRLESY